MNGWPNSEVVLFFKALRIGADRLRSGMPEIVWSIDSMLFPGRIYDEGTKKITVRYRNDLYHLQITNLR